VVVRVDTVGRVYVIYCYR